MENKENNNEIKKENQKKYSKMFYEKKKGEKHECELCHGHYTHFNKYHHIKSNRHQLFIK